MEEQLQQIRTKLINSMLKVGAILAIPALLAVLLRIVQTGWLWIYLVQSILLILIVVVHLFYSRLTIKFKTHFLSVLFLAFSFIGALKFSLSSTYFICLIPIFLNLLIFGKRMSKIYGAISIAILLIIGIVHSNKLINTDIDFNIYNFNGTSWTLVIIVMLSLVVILIYAIGWFYEYYTQNIIELIQKTKEQEIAQQELIIKEQLLQEQNEEYLALNEELNERNKDFVIAKEKAEESDRLKTAFLNNISHEVRTPLNAIAGFSQLITEPDQPPEKLKAFSQMISTSSDKLIEIITDIIEISEITTKQIQTKISEFDFIPFIKNLFDNFKEKAEEGKIDFLLNINITFAEYFIKSDIGKLGRIVNHIIDNAIKFTHQGSVVIDCDIVKSQGIASLQIKIKDTGIGITNEMQKVIFEPFRQAETKLSRNFGGTGLGLSIAKAYIELLNGSISLQSEINNGTTVIISLPIIETGKPPKTEIILKPKQAINTILIAEDDLSNYKYLCDLLDGTNIKILHAPNGKLALEMCKISNNIDLILMDIEMPVMDGHTAAKLIREFSPELAIIAQTAYALDGEKQKYEDVFDDYMTKPIRRAVFKQKLQKYLNI